MTDLRPNLPSLAYIEMQILGRAAKAGALEQATRSVEKDYGLSPGSLGTGVVFESRVVSLLYCLIVLPKEIWNISHDHDVLQRLRDNWLGKVRIESKKGEKTDDHPPSLYQFIRHLRNAMSHANFSFKSSRFEFWDCDPRTSEVFKASLAKDDLVEFLESVGSMLANMRTWQSGNSSAHAEPTE